MRKISKSRADDDVVSSTNGSLLNDERAGSPSNDVNEKDAGSDDDTHANTEVNDGEDNDSDANYGAKKSKRSTLKSKSKKRKSGKENEDSDDGSNANANTNDGDDHDSDADYSSKKAAKKSTPKSKGKKRKSGKENNEKYEDSDDDSNANAEAKDGDSDTDYNTKKTPKKSAPKSKGKKRNSGKEKPVEEEYEVEQVVDSKKIKGKLHYLIRWKGYSADSDTWEPENTLSCPDLISKYNDEKDNEKIKSKEEKAPKGKKGIKRKGKRDTSRTPSKRPKSEWDSKAADANAEYEVERILEVHHKKTGKREFLIHWKGWSSKFDSWEPENNLNCSELIEKFMEKVSAAKTSDSRNLRVAPETTNRFTLQAPTTGRRLSKRRGQSQRVRYDNAE